MLDGGELAACVAWSTADRQGTVITKHGAETT